MPALMSFDERLAEAIGDEPDPSKYSEETLRTLKGARVIAEVHFRLSETESPELHEQFKDLMASYMWEEATIIELQDGLRRIFANQPELKHRFSAFLDAPTSSKAEQAAAKTLAGDFIGTTITMKRKPNLPSHRETRQFLCDIDKYFEHQAEEKFTEYTHTGMQLFFAGTEEAKEVILSKMAEFLKDDPELVERLYIQARGSNKVLEEDGTDVDASRSKL